MHISNKFMLLFTCFSTYIGLKRYNHFKLLVGGHNLTFILLQQGNSSSFAAWLVQQFTIAQQNE
jgi:hypothetical protein